MAVCDFVRRNKRKLILILTPLLLLPLPLQVQTQESKCGYALLLMAVFWATEALPISVTALIPIILFPMMGVSKVSDLASQYFTGTIFVFLGGMSVAVCIEKWNIHRRFALKLLLLLGTTTKWLTFGFMITTAFLSMWVSNTATTAMMIPIGQAVLIELVKTKRRMSICEEEKDMVALIGINGVKEGHEATDSKSSTQMKDSDEEEFVYANLDQKSQNLCKLICLCICYSANCGGIATLTGTAPNLVLKGQLDLLAGGRSGISFATWFLFGFPITVMSVLINWFILQVIFLGWKSVFTRDTTEENPERIKSILQKQYDGLGEITFAQKAVCVHFVLLVVLCFSLEPEFVPGWGQFFKPGYVSDAVPGMIIAVSLFIFPSRRRLKVILREVCSCSQDLQMNGDTLYLHSPGFTEQKNYDVNLHCKWNIKTTFKVTVNFTFFELEYQYKCDWDYVLIYHGQCGSATSRRFCGTRAPSVFTSEGHMCIEFVSDYMITKPGFQIIVSQTPERVSNIHVSSSSLLFNTETNGKPATAFDQSSPSPYTINSETIKSSIISTTDLPITDSTLFSKTFSEAIEATSTSSDGLLFSSGFNENLIHSSTPEASFLYPSTSLSDLTNTNIFTSYIMSTDGFDNAGVVYTAISNTRPVPFNNLQSEGITSASINSNSHTRDLLSTFSSYHKDQVTPLSSLTALDATSVLLTKIYFSDNSMVDSYDDNALRLTLLDKYQTDLSKLTEQHGQITHSESFEISSEFEITNGVFNSENLLSHRLETIDSSKVSSASFTTSWTPNSLRMDWISSASNRSFLHSNLHSSSIEVKTNLTSSPFLKEPVTLLSTSIIETRYNTKTNSLQTSMTSTMNMVPGVSTVSLESVVDEDVVPKVEVLTQNSTFPVACFVDEHVLLENSGILQIHIPGNGTMIHCTWLLLAKDKYRIEFNITNLAIHPEDCKEDRGLFIYEGLSNERQYLKRVCPESLDKSVLSNKSSMTVLASVQGETSLIISYASGKKVETCPGKFSRCSADKCLPSDWWCDSEVDCPDGKDEQNCGLCGTDKFRCGNGQCLPTVLRCNGRPDCGDKSDEFDCAIYNDGMFRIRYGLKLLSVSGNGFNKTIGEKICKFSSSKLLEFNIISSNIPVCMSLDHNRKSNIVLNRLSPTTSCKTEVRLTCSKNECGHRSSLLMVPYIIGGSKSYEGQWPWIVALKSSNQHVCGGTILNELWILTAGHCVQNFLDFPHVLTVVVGTISRNGKNEGVFRVSEIILHPDYNSIDNDDVALLRLQRPLTFDDYIRPICIRTNIPNNSVCYIVGWGITNSKDKTLPDELEHAKVNLFSNSKCNRTYSNKINERMICAGILDGGADTCQGDSGGPLMCSEDQSSWFLAGVTSWGSADCGAPKSPGVYTRVTEYINWIWSVIEGNDESYRTSYSYMNSIEEKVCDFEEPGLCEFNDISSSQFMWTKRKAGWTYGGQPLTDSTLKSNKGHFLYADKFLVSDSMDIDAILHRNLSEYKSTRCLKFSYQTYGNSALPIKVVGILNDRTQTTLMTMSISSASWKTIEVEIPRTTTELIIKASRKSPAQNGGIAIDDIKISRDICNVQALYDCSFDNGNSCGYTNYTQDSAFWYLQSVSTSTMNNWVLRYDGHMFTSYGKARLLSPVMSAEGPRCITLRFKMCLSFANNLSVVLGFVFNNDKYFGSILWTRSFSNDNCFEWTKGFVNIPSMPLDHFIAFQVERKHLDGDVYMDDIHLYSGNCITEE